MQKRYFVFLLFERNFWFTASSIQIESFGFYGLRERERERVFDGEKNVVCTKRVIAC
jgi:hypothetical protein